MKKNCCSHKLRYEKYLKLICKYLSNNMYIELIKHKDFIWRDYLCHVYEKNSYDRYVSDP